MAEGQFLSVAPTPRDAKGKLENSRAGELATYLQESLETMQLASELAQQEMYSALELVRRQGQGRACRVPCLCRQYTQPSLPQLREKSQALEVSVAELVRQVKDMSDHFLALSWRLDLQEQTLSLRLCEVSAQSSPGKAHLDGRGPAAPQGGGSQPTQQLSTRPRGPNHTGAPLSDQQSSLHLWVLFALFLTALLRFSAPTIQFPLSKCVLPWFFVYSELYSHHHNHF